MLLTTVFLTGCTSFDHMDYAFDSRVAPVSVLQNCIRRLSRASDFSGYFYWQMETKVLNQTLKIQNTTSIIPFCVYITWKG